MIQRNHTQSTEKVIKARVLFGSNNIRFFRLDWIEDKWFSKQPGYILNGYKTFAGVSDDASAREHALDFLNERGLDYVEVIDAEIIWPDSDRAICRHTITEHSVSLFSTPTPHRIKLVQ